MANEVRVQYPSGHDLYFRLRDESGQVAQTTTSTFVTWVDGNAADYDIALVDKGGGIYVGDVPAWVTAIDGSYEVQACYRATGTPLYTDKIIGTGQVTYVDGVEQTIPEIIATLLGILMDRIRAGRSLT